MVTLRLDQVSFAYPDTPILRQISCDLASGQLVGIVGPNGAGKSTLLKLIDRILLPCEGTIWLGERRLDSIPLHELAAHIAFIPQQPERFPFRVKDIVRMARTPYLARFQRERAVDHQAVEEALAKTGIEALAQRSYLELSGGERQRVMLARALAQQTPVLLLDEPTNHLDIQYQVGIGRLLREEADRGTLCIAVLHDLNLAAAFCDWIILLVDGIVTEQGTPAAVLEPAVLEQAYQLPLQRLTHPQTGKPIIVP